MLNDVSLGRGVFIKPNHTYCCEFYIIHTVTFITLYFFFNFIAQKVSNIHLVTEDFKIVPLTNLLKLFLAGRVTGGGSILLGLY